MRLRILQLAALPVLLATASLLPIQAKQPAEEFTRFMFGHLRAGILDCPHDLPGDHAGRSIRCATYNSTFDYFKSQWEVNLERHDLPGRVRELSHWTLSGGRYEAEYEVEDQKVTVIFEMERGLLLAIYHPGEEVDSDDLSERLPSARNTLHIAGFGGVTLPRVIVESRVEPEYPEDAKRDGMKGSVTLSITVNEDGSVSEVTVLSSRPEDRGFGEAALEAVRQWRYEPALFDGEPVAAKHTVIVEFAPPPKLDSPPAAWYFGLLRSSVRV
jgi:TonB family protein